MWNWVQKFLTPPVFKDDEGKTSIARYLHNLTLWATGLMIIYGISLAIVVPQMAMRSLTIIPLAACQLVILVWIRQGRVKLGGMSSLTVFWLFFAASSAWSGGVRSVPYSGNILVVLTAAILWGRRTALVYAVMCLFSGVILIWAEMAGMLPPLATTPLSALLLQGVYFLVGAGSLYLGTFSIKEALEHSEQRLVERRQVEQTLRDSENMYRRAIEAIGGVPYVNDYKLHKYAYLGEGIRAITGYGPEEMNPARWAELIQEYTMLGESAGSTREEALKHVWTGDVKYWQTDARILTQDGKTRWINDSSVQLFDKNGKPHGSIGILQDVTARKQAEAELKNLAEQAHKRATQLATVNEVSRAVSTLRDLDSVLKMIYQQAQRVLKLDVFFIGLYDADTNQISYPIMYDAGKRWEESNWRHLNPGSLSAQVIESGKPQLINKTAKELEHASASPHRIGDRTLNAVSLMIAPLPSGERIIGVISAQSYMPNAYSQDDLELFVGIAYQVATAIDNSQLYTNVQQELLQRQKAEHQLYLSERRFRAIIENVSDGVAVLNTDGTINLINSADSTITGYSSNERLGKNMLNIIYAEDHKLGMGLLESSIAQPNTPIPFTFRLLAKDGSVRWIEGMGINMFDEPAIQGILVNYRDISERKRAEQAIQSNLAWRNAILDNSPDMTWLMDVQYRYIAVNQVFANTIRMLPEKLVGKSDFDLWPLKRAQKYRSSDQDVIQGRQRVYTEDHFTGRKGRERWFETVKTPIFNAQGDVIGITGTSREITERKLAEVEREKLIRELEARNAELERFTYTVSHDLKSPLITIRGFLGYLENDFKSGNYERGRADMRRIITATDKMQRLLGELLELSRIGRMMNPPENIPFDDIVIEAMELVRGQLTAKSIRVTVANNLPTVQGDRARLVEVVQNLIDNASKFTSAQPQPHIEIGRRGDDEDGKPVFFVRDNGLGIEPQYHERIFGLFNKLDAQGEGTGVGLALVKRIIEVHGGRIWVESEGLGKGTTFCFTLPQAGV